MPTFPCGLFPLQLVTIEDGNGIFDNTSLGVFFLNLLCLRGGPGKRPGDEELDDEQTCIRVQLPLEQRPNNDCDTRQLVDIWRRERRDIRRRTFIQERWFRQFPFLISGGKGSEGEGSAGGRGGNAGQIAALHHDVMRHGRRLRERHCVSGCRRGGSRRCLWCERLVVVVSWGCYDGGRLLER